jgi:hypothetical protein
MRPTASRTLRADRWVSRSVVNRAEGMEVVGLLRWFKKYAADRFTAPYEDVNTV